MCEGAVAGMCGREGVGVGACVRGGGGVGEKRGGGLRGGVGYTGGATVAEVRSNGTFVKIAGAGVREGHVDDVQITRESPNYRVGS